jgi:hypothetical protein
MQYHQGYDARGEPAEWLEPAEPPEPPVVIEAPTVTWVTASTDTTPGFLLDLPGGLLAGDVLVCHKSADGAGAWTVYFTQTLTALDISNDVITVSSVTALADGNYDFRFRVVRGDITGAWSAIVDVAIGAAVEAAPLVVSLSPLDNAIDIAITASPAVTFDRNVQFGVGAIELYDSDNDLIESFDVSTEVGTGNGQVSIAGAVLTINPTASMENNKGHYIKIAATAIKNMSGVAFAGITNATTWNWTTVAAVSVPANAYITTLSDLSNPGLNGSYTFAGVSLGTPHANRLVILFTPTSTPIASITVAGVTPTVVVASSSRAIYQAAVPTGATGTIVVAHTGTPTQLQIPYWVIYPASPTPVDFAAAATSALTDAIAADVAVVPGGYLVYGGYQAFVGTLTPTWNGSDTLVQDLPSTLYESPVTVCAGHVVTTVSNSTFDLTISTTASGSKTAIAASWGPQ